MIANSIRLAPLSVRLRTYLSMTTSNSLVASGRRPGGLHCIHSPWSAINRCALLIWEAADLPPHTISLSVVSPVGLQAYTE
jgi:hypothetical protein